MNAVQFRDSVVKKFNDLITEEIKNRGEEPATARSIANAVLEQAETIAKQFYSEVVFHKLVMQAGWLLQRMRPPPSAETQDLLPGYELPYRIPVPIAGRATDDSDCKWQPLRTCSISDLRKHKLAVDYDMVVRGNYQTSINLLWLKVFELCNGDETQILGDLLAAPTKETQSNDA